MTYYEPSPIARLLLDLLPSGTSVPTAALELVALLLLLALLVLAALLTVRLVAVVSARRTRGTTPRVHIIDNAQEA